MLVCVNKDAGSEILEGIGPPTQEGKGGRGPNALKYQNPKDVPQAKNSCFE